MTTDVVDDLPLVGVAHLALIVALLGFFFAFLLLLLLLLRLLDLVNHLLRRRTVSSLALAVLSELPTPTADVHLHRVAAVGTALDESDILGHVLLVEGVLTLLAVGRKVFLVALVALADGLWRTC